MKIKELREAAGLGQVQLAKAAGVSQPSIVQWEAGSAYPRADKLPVLADILGCTIDALFGRALGPAPPAEKAS